MALNQVGGHEEQIVVGDCLKRRPASPVIEPFRSLDIHAAGNNYHRIPDQDGFLAHLRCHQGDVGKYILAATKADDVVDQLVTTGANQGRIPNLVKCVNCYLVAVLIHQSRRG